ncbi:MAG: hypothetical protein WCJ58_02105 [bacterium]
MKILNNRAATTKYQQLITDFYQYTFNTKDLQRIRELGIAVYLETACIDERSNAQTIKMGQIRLEDNSPGGGFDFYDEVKITALLELSHGNLILDPHKGCGWGGIRLQIALEDDPAKVIDLIVSALESEVFRNAVAKSHLWSKYFRFEADYKQLLQTTLAIKSNTEFQKLEHKDLLELAFVYGKMLDLQEKFFKIAKKTAVSQTNIQISPDLLFEMPHKHIATSAIINLTKRVFYSRIPSNDEFESFYADLKLTELAAVLPLIAQIMAGNHSSTKDLPHEFYLFVDDGDLEITKNILQTVSEKLQAITTAQTIVLLSIQSESNPKSKEELLLTVR